LGGANGHDNFPVTGDFAFGVPSGMDVSFRHGNKL
jgi:hypothetical protein